MGNYFYFNQIEPIKKKKVSVTEQPQLDNAISQHLSLLQPSASKAATQVLTSLLRLNLDGVGQRPVSHGGEGQDPDCVGLILEKAPHRGQEAVVHVVLLPVADRLIRLHGIIYTIATDLPIGLHRFLPLDDHGGAAQHSSLHVTGGTGRSLFPSASDH